MSRQPSLLGPPDPEVPCCMTSMHHPDDCSCWVPVVAPHPTEHVQQGPCPVRAARCGDCAYRRDSPERRDLEGDPMPYHPDQTFYCHDGMPQVIAYVHPSGAVVDAADVGDDYRPVIRNGRTWQADGRPAVVCAGWAADNRAAERARRR